MMIYFMIYLLGCIVSLAGMMGFIVFAISNDELDDMFSLEKMAKESIIPIIIIGTLMSWAFIVWFILEFRRK